MQPAQAPSAPLRIQRPPNTSTGGPARIVSDGNVVQLPGTTRLPAARAEAKRGFFQNLKEGIRNTLPGALERLVPGPMYTIVAKMGAGAREIAMGALRETRLYKKYEDKKVAVNNFLATTYEGTAKRKNRKLDDTNREIAAKESLIRAEFQDTSFSQDYVNNAVKTGMESRYPGLLARKKDLIEKIDRFEKTQKMFERNADSVGVFRERREALATRKLEGAYESVKATRESVARKRDKLLQDRLTLQQASIKVQVEWERLGLRRAGAILPGTRAFEVEQQMLKLGRAESRLSREADLLRSQMVILDTETTALEVKLGISEQPSLVTQPVANDDFVPSESPVSLPVTGQQNFAGWNTSMRGSPAKTPRSEGGGTEFLGQEFVTRQVSDWNDNLRVWGLSGIKDNPGNIVDKDFTNLSFDVKKINIAQLQAVFNSKIMKLVQAGIVTGNSEAFAKMSKFAQEIKLNKK